MTRDGPDTFWVVSSSATTVRDLDWLRRQGGIDATDETDAFAVLGVMGPAARDLLGWSATTGPRTFPFGTAGR